MPAAERFGTTHAVHNAADAVAVYTLRSVGLLVLMPLRLAAAGKAKRHSRRETCKDAAGL